MKYTAVSRAEGWKRSHPRRSICLRIAICLLVFAGLAGASPAQVEGAVDLSCRLGVVAHGDDLAGYPLEDLGLSSVSGTHPDKWPALPEGISYTAVLQIGGPDFESMLVSLPAWIDTHRGASWLVGDEPDNPNPDHDALTPEAYADRFYAVASLIHNTDPDARVGFGGITQPSPLRLRYLERAWQQLIVRAGTRAAASAMVDVWAIHVFISSETGSEDAGIPRGFEDDFGDARHGFTAVDSVSNGYFNAGVEAFRAWMAWHGEKEKPLWISAYGPVDSTVLSEDSGRFLTNSFSFLNTQKNPLSGPGSDGERLVQRWFWHSLDGIGNLYDFDADDIPTPSAVGIAYLNYFNPRLLQDDFLIAGLEMKAEGYAGPGSLVDERITIRVANAGGLAAKSPAKVSLMDGSLDSGAEVDSPQSLSLPGCGETGSVTFLWKGVQPFQPHTLYARVDLQPDPLAEMITSNNTKSFTIVTGPPRIFLPLVSH